MSGLQKLIEDLNERAVDSDLLALLAASRERRLYNAALAATLRELVETLKREMDLRHASVLLPPNEIRLPLEKIKPPKPSNLSRAVQPLDSGQAPAALRS
jgi:hypothetical protein